jgi:hypothetical protein
VLTEAGVRAALGWPAAARCLSMLRRAAFAGRAGGVAATAGWFHDVPEIGYPQDLSGDE